MSTSVTPMMAQFLEIKAEYPTALLFYRMGDFYELFFDDAAAAAEALDIALTKRGKHNGADIPMCGVPVHAAEGYLLTLIRKGFRVAVCEQLENPKEAKKRGSKSVVKRGVVRLVTPGTLTEETLLQPRQSNFLAAYADIRGEGALAWVDISTGDLRYIPCPPVRLGPELARLGASELLLSDAAPQDVLDTANGSGASITKLFHTSFDSAAGQSSLADVFPDFDLAPLDRSAISALGALVEYIVQTQKGQVPLLRAPIAEHAQAFVSIDPATRRNLEITETLSGTRKGSLLQTIDRTVTAVGARLLAQRVTAPSQRVDTINARLEGVDYFFGDAQSRQNIRNILKSAPDLERALGRLALGRGGPRDMKAIGTAIARAADLHTDIPTDCPDILRTAAQVLTGFEGLSATLDQALTEDPPLLARDGGFVAPGYNSDLDELVKLRDEARSIIASLQATYADQTDISSLKIKHNNVLGYFVETTAMHAEKMMSPPLSEVFIHRQTTANQVRFTTVALSDLETKIINAAGQAQALELQIFEELRQTILSYAPALQECARGMAEIDVAAALADQAAVFDWVKPTLSNGREFHVTKGRHPVVESVMKSEGTQQFVANDCAMSPDAAMVWLLTGPNMAGKSTYLRQNALIALLAQAGSFVPAAQAQIGAVSQIFSRVGASDDLARGRSTFMVEMIETAAILNNADDRALVILDEIGRGTSTYDGLSIAWATLEYLHDVNKCRALFATHYHELTQVSAKLGGVDNATVAVREWEGDVIFLHEVRTGTADRSYGVQVARLAGLPDAVLARARVVLDALEDGERDRGAGPAAIVDDLPLFSAIAPTPAAKGGSEIEMAVKALDPDAMTAKEALDMIYQLKAKLKN
ncbi:MAG: DNA mismatch repair protein MutS [Planktomarina sp.]